MDEAENYAELLTSYAATAVCSASDADEAADTAEQLKQQATLRRQCRDAIFKRVRVLKKKKLLGSQVTFPELPTSFEPDVLPRRMPPGSVLKLDKFNGRWEASWKAPTGSFERLSRSWGLCGHKQCIIEVMDWVWGLAIGYGVQCPYNWPLQPAAAQPKASGGDAAGSSAGAAPAPEIQPKKRARKAAGQKTGGWCSSNSSFEQLMCVAFVL